MDWITGMQNAIDYIEEHITEKVDYEEIARCSCLSSYNFQRVFGILCGYTLGEYIRNRRLSLAGQDLVQTGMKVIDDLEIENLMENMIVSVINEEKDSDSLKQHLMGLVFLYLMRHIEKLTTF